MYGGSVPRGQTRSCTFNLATSLVLARIFGSTHNRFQMRLKRYSTSMTKRILTACFLGVFAFVVMNAQAQNLRPEDTFYIKPRIGVAWHLGDTEQSPFNFNMDNWKVDGAPEPLAGGLELGYQFSQTTSLSLGWQITNHPLALYYGDSVPAGVTDFASWYNGGQLLLRFAAPSRIAPFLGVGAHVSKGQDGRTSLTFGPALALGLDIVMSDRVSLVLENTSNFTFPDDGFDAQDAPDDPNAPIPTPGDDFAPFDVMNAVTLGLKINFKSAFTPVEVLSVDCVSTLQTGETGTFTASVNADATLPVNYSWNFGDGTTGTGMSVTHSWSRPGTYTVTVTASNGRSSDSESCTVTVEAPPAPANIISVNASETRFQVCEPVTVEFDANVQGDTPLNYEWNFGDGATGTGREVSHTYTEPGTYTVTLTASNAAGSDTRSITITAEECRAGICYEITEMNSVYFGRNSSTLTAEARAALQENIEIFEQCPNLCARLEGWAAPGERNPQELSEARARAVEQFYVDNGLAASRFTTVGMGAMPGTSKKEGASQARRVDTIPVQCVDLR